MYAYPVEELAWAMAREREEEARQTRPHTEERPRPAETQRSWLARWRAGDGSRQAADLPLSPAGNGCC